jgi:putative FmdB family regulatory protein
MPCYQYICDGCELELEVKQGFHDKPLKKCPECKKMKLQRVICIPYVRVIKDPTTVGQLAERNTKKMGKYEFEAREKDRKEFKKKGKEEMSKLPGSPIKKSTDAPWYRRGTTGPDMSLNNLTPEQKERYIITGEK